MQASNNIDFKPLEICEALGGDNIWHAAKVIQKNEDGTFSCELPKYATTWDHVSSHNLRKVHDRTLPRDMSGDEVAKKPSASARKSRKVNMFDETFSDFDEKPPRDFVGPNLPKGSVVRFSEKHNVREELSIQIDHVLDDYRKIHRALSSIGGSEFSEAGPKAEVGEGKLKFTITHTKEKTAERKLTILLPESPTGYACASPFSWFLKRRKPKMKSPCKKTDRRNKVKKSLEETIQDDVRRGSNLYRGKNEAQNWEEEDVELYQNEIQAEINRLRNASSVYDPHVSETSFADAYMSLGRFRLSGASLPRLESKRPENVVWLLDGTMVNAEERPRGTTYCLEDPTLDLGVLPYAKRLQLSNQWDVDSTMISTTWTKGDQVEVWLETGWIPATVTDCFVENNMSKLRISCNQSQEEICHTINRFGGGIRPWGYLEVDSSCESDSE